jgi:hypothetical protein
MVVVGAPPSGRPGSLVASAGMSGDVRVNASHVVHETIDGETILIHLGTGSYYSIDGAGSELWTLVAAGATRGQILASAMVRYRGDPVDVEVGVSRFLDQLLAEGLVVEDPAPAPATGARLPEGSVPFAQPALHVYTDMQEFMLVDPLHDVDEVAGWPHAKAD